MNSADRPIFIGICGGSASGKTSVTRALREDLGVEMTGLVELDSYYRSLGHLPLEERAAVNFDHPDALDWELLHGHLRALIAGRSIEIPVYDFRRHDRSDETITQHAVPVIFIEGILVFWNRFVRQVLDAKIFLDTPADLRLLRRVRRDTLERGRTLEAVLDQYERLVRPMHEEFVEVMKTTADIILPRGIDNPVGLEMVKSLVRAKASARGILPKGRDA